MNTKKSFNATPISITKWAYQKSKSKLTPPLDELIIPVEYADFLLTIAQDPNCPRRAFILKILYYLVGISVSKHVDVDIAKIKVLLEKANTSSDQVILNWVNRSKIILNDLKKFDYVEWCQGGFSEKDLPTTV